MTAGGAGASSGHLPVLYAQVMEGLAVKAEGTYLDGTFGRGGHARGVLAQLGPGGRLLLMDKDPEAIAVAEREFGADPRVSIRRGSFADLARWDETHVRDYVAKAIFPVAPPTWGLCLGNRPGHAGRSFIKGPVAGPVISLETIFRCPDFFGKSHFE